MSTRSIIGTTDGTAFEGIYCHFDGSPSSMAPELATIITRDGADALPVLTGKTQTARGGKTAAWSAITAVAPAPDTALPDMDYSTYLETVPVSERDPAVTFLYGHLAYSNEDARDRIAEGYGTVYLDNPLRFSGTLTDPDAETGWTEWAYLFTEDLTLVVYDVAGAPFEVGRFTREDLVALAAGDKTAVAAVERAECGEDYERCGHYAWVHDKTVPGESRNLSMGAWLGREPIPLDRAVGVICDGIRHETGGGSSVQYGVMSLYTRRGVYIPVAQVDRRGDAMEPFAGIELIFPPTKAEMAEASA